MSERTGQKEATYNAIHTVLESKDISFEDGSDVSGVLSTEHKKEVKRKQAAHEKINRFLDGVDEP